uniref:28S ribosomal protein S22, mitochondrial n=1 Tax=Strongyloides stercoralis TaxID=6248 RepID=A0A0K0DU14_STRER
MTLLSFSRYTLHKFVLRNTFFRSKSAWFGTNINIEKDLKVDVEALFVNNDVQTILKSLTGLDLANKIFTEKKVHSLERSHFALMTEEAYQNAVKKMEDIGKHYLQFVPMKEPRTDDVEILDKDPEIANFDTSKYVFTDITFDATDQDRTVVIREPDGTLRLATPSEHDRMNRFYYEKPNRPVFEPAVFSGVDLEKALEARKHEFVLDWACWFYEPDDLKYIELSKKVFDEIIANEKFDVLHSTRHYGQFVFYCALNRKLSGLLNYYGKKDRLADAANFIKLYKIIYPNWRTAVSAEDDDYKVVKDFLNLKMLPKEEVKDLMQLVFSSKEN